MKEARMPTENKRNPEVSREGLVQALKLMLIHLPENALYTLWKLVSYPPALLKRAQVMIINSSESADLFYDACRLDRIVRYLDAKHEENLMSEVENSEAKKEVRQAIDQLRGRLGMAITILRSQLGEIAQKYKISFRGMSRLGTYEKVYERSGQRLFSREAAPAPQVPPKEEAA
jgi:hypothetical protein